MKTMDVLNTSFDEWMDHPKTWRITLAVVVVLFAAAFLVGYIEYGVADMFLRGYWRNLFLPPIITLYILVIAPRISLLEAEVFRVFKQLASLSDDDLTALAHEAASVSPGREVGAVVGGMLFGLAVTALSARGDVTWVTAYALLANPLSFGILSWTIYASTVSIKFTAVLLKQPLHVDLFNLTPYKIAGQHSLLLALAFVGGITISLIFSAFDLTALQQPIFWIINTPILTVPLVIFFLNMSPTQKIIAAAKTEALNAVGGRISAIALDLLQSGGGQVSNRESLSGELEALLAYEQRLQQIQTWPYDVSTLRTLFVSVLVPALTVLAQVYLRTLLGG